MEVRQFLSLCMASLLVLAIPSSVAWAQYPYANASSSSFGQAPEAELWARDAGPSYRVASTRNAPLTNVSHAVSNASSSNTAASNIGTSSGLMNGGASCDDWDLDGCGSCCVSSSACRKPWHVVLGVEATFLQPNVGDTGLLHLTPGGRLVTSRLADLDDYYAAPRVWLGVENCNGHGIRARYWDFDASAWDYDTLLIPIGLNAFDTQTFDASSRLEAYTIDLEYTRRFQSHNWRMLGSIGVRHAKLDRAESLSGFTTDLLSGPTPLGVATQILSERSISATGLTLGLEGTRPLRNWNINFFWNVRGSALWGDNRSNNISTMYIAPVGLGAGAVNAANVLLLDETDVLYILEFQTGVEWRHPLKCCCAEMFARVAFEYQYWDAEESGGDYLTQVVVDVDPINFGETRDMRVDFIGLAVSCGIAW